MIIARVGLYSGLAPEAGTRGTHFRSLRHPAPPPSLSGAASTFTMMKRYSMPVFAAMLLSGCGEAEKSERIAYGLCYRTTALVYDDESSTTTSERELSTTIGVEDQANGFVLIDLPENHPAVRDILAHSDWPLVAYDSNGLQEEIHPVKVTYANRNGQPELIKMESAADMFIPATEEGLRLFYGPDFSFDEWTNSEDPERLRESPLYYNRTGRKLLDRLSPP